MPKILYLHLYDEDGNNSQGFFFTISQTRPKGKQLSIMSSGNHVGIFPTLEMALVRIKQLVDVYKDRIKFFTVNEYQAEENEFHFTFSGGPGECNNIYKLDKDGDIFFFKGENLLKIN